MMNTFQQPNKRYKYSTPTLIDTSTSSSTSSNANDSTTSTTPPLSPTTSTTTATTTDTTSTNNISTSILQSNILGNKFNKIANFSYAAVAAVANCNQMMNKNYYQTNDYENYPPMPQHISLQQQQQQHQHQQHQYYNNYYNNTNNLQNRSNCSSGRSSLNSNPTDTSLTLTPSPTLRQQQQQQQQQQTQNHDYNNLSTIPCQLNNDTTTTTSYRTNTNPLASSNIANINSNTSLPLKKRRAIPSEQKDMSYWEKRRKNNESAKRSRDNKRSKEETLLMRNLYLEQENLQLKTQIAMYEAQIENLSRLAHGLGGHLVNSSSNN